MYYVEHIAGAGLVIRGQRCVRCGCLLETLSVAGFPIFWPLGSKVYHYPRLVRYAWTDRPVRNVTINECAPKQ